MAVPTLPAQGAPWFAYAQGLDAEVRRGPIRAVPGDNVQALLTQAASEGRDLELTPGTYTLTSGLTWSATRHSIRGGGQVTLDFTALSSGYAITCAGTASGGTDSFAGITHTLSGIRIVGTQSSSTVVDGIRVADAAGGGNYSMVGFENVYIVGFRDQWFYGNSTWCVSQYRCMSRGAARYALNLDGQTSAGENYQFLHCTIADASNAGNTGTAVFTNAAGNIDATFTACSFDYCDTLIDHNGGAITLLGCHLENNEMQPMVLIGTTPGGFRTMLSISGGAVAPTEANPGRTHLIEVKSGSNEHVYVTTTGVTWQTWPSGCDIFRNMSTGAPTFSHTGGQFDGTPIGTRAATLGQHTSLAVNGDMEGSTTLAASATFPIYPGRNWAKGGTVITATFDTTIFRSGTRSLQVTNNGTAATDGVKQMVAIAPGRRVYVIMWVRAAGITGGDAEPRVSWYFGDYNTRLSVATSFTKITADQGWTAYFFRATPPPGITAALIDVQTTNLNGSIWLDDVVVSQL